MATVVVNCASSSETRFHFRREKVNIYIVCLFDKPLICLHMLLLCCVGILFIVNISVESENHISIY